MDDNQIIDIVLNFEGGFVDNPADRGGATNFGITAAQLGRWLGQSAPASVDQVHSLTIGQARAIYQKWYITEPGFDEVDNPQLRLVLVDSGVLHGPGRATRWLQQALQVTADGKLDQHTRDALASHPDLGRLALVVLGYRFNALASIVATDRSQAVFLRGWTSRAVALLDYV